MCSITKHITQNTRVARHLALFLIVGGFTVGGAAVAAQASRLVLGADYPAVARETLQRATASIDLAMYFIILDPRRADDPVAPLVDALVGSANWSRAARRLSTRDPARPPVFAARHANQYCVTPLVEPARRPLASGPWRRVHSRRPRPPSPPRFTVDTNMERAMMRARSEREDEVSYGF